MGSAQSNGGDTGYAIAFVVFGLTAAVALAMWTALAVRMARLVELPGSVLQVKKLLAVGVGVCMGLMLIAVSVWWGALAAPTDHLLPDKDDYGSDCYECCQCGHSDVLGGVGIWHRSYVRAGPRTSAWGLTCGLILGGDPG